MSDPGAMLIPKTVRVRSRVHLARVGEHECCICGARPVQVHHLTHTQPKARGLKAGDDQTVPLCLEHHLGGSGVHARGDERAWWQEQGKDGAAIAKSLWEASEAGVDLA